MINPQVEVSFVLAILAVVAGDRVWDSKMFTRIYMEDAG